MPSKSTSSSTTANGANTPSPFAPKSRGEGVDRKLEQRWLTPRRIGWALGLVVLLGGLGHAVWTGWSDGQTLNVDRERVTIATVEAAPFQEFISVSATVVPERTVFIDAMEGGRVEEIFVEEGAMVEAGDPLLRLSNNDLRLRLLNSETQLGEQQSRMEELRFQVEQNRLNLRQQLAQMDYEITLLERRHARNAQLHERDLIAEEEYLDSRDELRYQQRRRGLTRDAFAQDSLAQRSRMEQMAQAVASTRQNFEVLQEALSNLTIRAPISGQLTALDADVGAIQASGTRFGQVDATDGFRMRVQVDEFYIARVVPGQAATARGLSGGTHELEVARVYPEVRDGRFDIDLAFVGDPPEQLRRGQSVRVQLELGQSEEATLLARGGFYQDTGGRWAYVLTDDATAVRQPIQLGRQNPNHFEVLDGLEPGDRVITSGYGSFGGADRLVLR